MFSDNVANSDGGAMYVYGTDVFWPSDAMFSRNTAFQNGGAISLL